MKRLVAVLFALALAGCAVTGQPAKPGVAATLDGNTVTIADVATFTTTLEDMGFRFVDPGAALTLLLLQPTIEKVATDKGFLPDDETVTSDAGLWIASNKVENVAVTDKMTDVVRLISEFRYVIGDADGAKAIVSAANNIADNAVINPQYGPFTIKRFSDSLTAQTDAVNKDADGLSFVAYLLLKDVTGLDPAAFQDWMVEPSTAPAASPSPAAVG